MTIRVAKVPGAKWRLVDWYIAHLPAKRVYLEPYFGSGAAERVTEKLRLRLNLVELRGLPWSQAKVLVP